MYPPWKRGLTTCLQYIVRDADDVEVEAGEVNVGELRRRAFSELQKTLTDEQTLALAWFALADVGVWPQLDVTEAHALVATAQTVSPRLPVRPASARTPRDAGYRAAAAILVFIAQARARLKSPLATRPPDFELLRVNVNALARFRRDKVLFWEQWLRRVIESAVTSTPEAACAHALATLGATLKVPARFEYAATRPASTTAGSDGPFQLTIVSPRQGGSVVASIGQLTGVDPIKRKISATLIPSVPIDPYRMGYLLRSVCFAELLDDAKSGLYDSVACTNASTGEVWSYVAT